MSPLRKLTLLALAHSGNVAAYRSHPIVDLGYGIYQGSFHQGLSDNYNFSNVRYGAVPIRFGKPVAPLGRNTTVDRGEQGRLCPQALAAWELWAADVAGSFVSGVVPQLSEAQKKALESPSNLGLPLDPRETEDCLFLDVVTPVKTFANAKSHSRARLAPVIVWFYGGGYTVGDKAGFEPSGLIDASYTSSSEGLIFVSVNSRLGAFGWLSGSKLDSSMVANAALYDQRLALEWVQEHILQFGGDPDRVTIMGQSSGGASILHHLTAFGGKSPKKLFKRAIPQSMGYVRIANERLEDDVVERFLSLANVSDLQAARGLPYPQIALANRLLISDSYWGTSTVGPYEDGVFIPEMPDQLLRQGRHVYDVDLLIGFNRAEGLVHTSPEVVDEATYRVSLEQAYAGAHPTQLHYIQNTMYPPVFDGSYGYTNQTDRSSITRSESFYTCRRGELHAAYGDRAKSYYINLYPGLHAVEIPYTFYDGKNPGEGVNASIATTFQELLTSFASTGMPSSPGLPGGVPTYGNETRMLEVADMGFSTIKDPGVTSRCKFWNENKYL
ncbi:hypothetical protein NM208_g10787 [Fusarium decemcellulare]|uniref:Uncharacterized protein n=1 Tax=Fusarium decemcellulare TaxID=57161 RepID=A0ACC1RWL9_9HYPO|nr:hypothetical protein NM208_g10787 [Fusarium decemcellulare]